MDTNSLYKPLVDALAVYAEFCSTVGDDDPRCDLAYNHWRAACEATDKGDYEMRDVMLGYMDAAMGKEC